MEKIQNPKLQVQDWAGGGYRVFGKQGKDIVTRFHQHELWILVAILKPFLQGDA